MKIHFCLMTQNEIEDLVPNVTQVLPYVDTVTICDNGSCPNTFIYLRNWASIEPKMRLFLHPWTGSFPAARNNYLDHVNEIAEPGDWILTLDPDEFIEAKDLNRLRSYIETAEKHNKNMIGFQCRSVSLKGDQRVWENLDNYWKRFLIKWNPEMRYGAHGGQVHEYISGIEQKIWDPGSTGSIQSSLIYEHRKQENIIWLRGLRNMWHGGGGANGQHAHINEWQELRSICNSLGLDTWTKTYDYLLKGKIISELSNWFIKHRQDNWGDGSSEFREAYKTYYRLFHPEEEPEEFRGEHIP